MKTQAFRLRLLAVAAVFAAVLSSCSDTAERLLQTVPKESSFVLSMNPADLAKKAGKGQSKKDASGAEIQKISSLLSGKSGIDPRRLVVFAYEGKMWATFAVDDEDDLKTSLEMNEASDVQGFKVLESGGLRVLVADGQGWLVEGNNTDYFAEKCKMFASLDEEGSVTALPQFSKNMQGSDINGFVNMPVVWPQVMQEMLLRASAGPIDSPEFKILGGSYCFLATNFEKNDIRLTARLVDKDGNNVIGKLNPGKLDADILRYFDKNTSMVFAMSAPRHMLDIFGRLMGESMKQSGYMAMFSRPIMQFFQNLEGDFAIGASVQNISDASALKGAAFRYRAVFRLKKSKVAEIRRALSGQLGMMGFAPDGNGCYQLPVDGMMLHVGIDGDCLYVSTDGGIPAESYKDISAAAGFAGKSSAFYLDFSKGTMLSSTVGTLAGMPVSGHIYAYGDDEKGEMVVHFDDTSESGSLAYLLKLAQALNK